MSILSKIQRALTGEKVEDLRLCLPKIRPLRHECVKAASKRAS